jgi:hypothetical protein
LFLVKWLWCELWIQMQGCCNLKVKVTGSFEGHGLKVNVKWGGGDGVGRWRRQAAKRGDWNPKEDPRLQRK